jgi:hypothetical protein
MTSDERYAVCKNCIFFWSIMKSCKKCGCFMPAKTKIKASECPLGKW